MEVYQLNVAFEIFDQCRAAFNPIAAIQISHVADELGFCAVNVAADDALRVMFARHLHDGLFVLGDVFHRRLGFVFEIRRERPITKTQATPDAIEMQVEIQNPVVKPRAELFEHAIELRQAVELMAMQD